MKTIEDFFFKYTLQIYGVCLALMVPGCIFHIKEGNWVQIAIDALCFEFCGYCFLRQAYLHWTIYVYNKFRLWESLRKKFEEEDEEQKENV